MLVYRNPLTLHHFSNHLQQSPSLSFRVYSGKRSASTCNHPSISPFSLLKSSAAGLCSSMESNSQTLRVSDSGLPDTETPSLYKVGEKVLACNNCQFYEAKVIDVDLDRQKYRVHYVGWKKRWDEWLDDESLKKYNDENVQNFMCKENPKRAAKAVHTPVIKQKISSVKRGKKRRKDSSDEKETDAVSLENFVSLHLPSVLKKQLRDDYEFISNGKLVKLPRSPNVDDIMNKYIFYRSEKEKGKVSLLLQEFTNGLICYFNKALPAMLLYKSEREQYVEAIKDRISPSAVYGAEHLLRLFVKLPELLANANIKGRTLRLLQPRFVNFFRFLKKNHSEFFLSTYHVGEETEASTEREKLINKAGINIMH